MAPGHIPIYPEPSDLVFLIDAMIDVAGSYSRGILYRFGSQLGKKYGTRILDEGMVQGDPLGPVLGMLGVSGWFKDSAHERCGDDLCIRLLHPFEEASRETQCDFMRGFLSGLGEAFDGPTYYEEEQEGDWIVFRGKKEGEKPYFGLEGEK